MSCQIIWDFVALSPGLHLHSGDLTKNFLPRVGAPHVIWASAVLLPAVCVSLFCPCDCQRQSPVGRVPPSGTVSSAEQFWEDRYSSASTAVLVNV